MNSIYLQGSDDVRSAASIMSSAASEMQRAAANISGALEQHQRFMDDWLYRLEAALAQKDT